jgi:parvulin-like peptidyl-prolyl isomerase
MSFVKLKYRIRHAVRPFFYAIVVIFIIGGAFSFSSYQRSQERRQGAGGGGKRKVAKYVATVNGKRLSRAELDQYLWYLSQRGNGLPVEYQRQVLTSWLEGKTQGILIAQAIEAEGIKVSNKEIRERREEMADEELAAQKEERVALAERLKRENITLEQYRQQRIAELEKSDRGGNRTISDELAYKKLEEKIKAQVQISDADLDASFEEVKGRHILIDPKRMKEKALQKLEDETLDLEEKQQAAKDAGKTPDPALQQRLDAIAADRQGLESRDWDAEASRKAEALLKEARGGADFAKLATENSDDPGSGAQGGDLGWFKRGRMVEEFDAAAFTLKPKEISSVVKSQFGYHIIQVLGRRKELPKDFKKNQQQYRDDYTEERKWRAWSAYQQKLKDSAQVEVHDPELAAYRLLDEGGAQDKAISLLDQAIQNDPNNAGARYESAKLWQSKGNKDKALALLLEIEKIQGTDFTVTEEGHVPGGGSAELMLTTGDLLRELKRNDEAVARYKEASRLADPVKQENQFVHFRLEMAFRELKEKELADKEKGWLERFRKSQESSGGSPFGGSFQVQ